MQNKNIVLFSSGVSEHSGIVAALRDALTERGYRCLCWRDLFASAKDVDHIALLPMLVKKIPTFDYAVLVCEGHDETVMMRGGKKETVHSMRDNVLFEIGLCVMALGTKRTVLVTDRQVRLPDDLTGLHGNIAIKRILYTGNDPGSCKNAGDRLTAYLSEIESVSTQIDRYIEQTGGELTPVVIGAASSSACGYITNFIYRMFEHIDSGVLFEGETERRFFPNEKVYLHILFPKEYVEGTSVRGDTYLDRFARGIVPAARNRPVDFRYTLSGDELHLYDFPTSLITSYDTARMILSLDADDQADPDAAERFTAKELNLFEATLRTLLPQADYLARSLNGLYNDLTQEAKMQMQDRIMDILQNRLYFESF